MAETYESVERERNNLRAEVERLRRERSFEHGLRMTAREANCKFAGQHAALLDRAETAEADLAAMRVALEKTIARIKDTGPTTCFECEITLMESAAALAAGGGE